MVEFGRDLNVASAQVGRLCHLGKELPSAVTTGSLERHWGITRWALGEVIIHERARLPQLPGRSSQQHNMSIGQA
jgi:hypothetical protein